MDNIDAQITESVVFSILGHKKVGPQLFGVFPGGRLEEYIKVGTDLNGQNRFFISLKSI